MEHSALISIGLPVALIIIMAGIGLSLRPGDFVHVARRPRGLVWGSLAQLVLMPALAFLLAWALALPPLVAAGLVVLAACPGGTSSNLITYLARGHLALSISLTVTASLVTILTLPLLTNLALDVFAEGGQRLQLPVLQTVAMLAVITVIPVAAGMGVRWRAPALAARAERAVGLFGAVVLAALILTIAVQLGDRLPQLLVQAGPACVALNLAGIALGLLATRGLGLPPADALTVAVELGIKNGTLGLMVTMTLLDSPEMGVPSAIYGLLMYGFGVGLIWLGRRRFAAA
ncbi:MAG: bile acid:sodium symporter family protein [Lysobacteraceae bacterium]